MLAKTLLTAEQRLDIIKEYKSGTSNKNQLSKKYNISWHSINYIIQNNYKRQTNQFTEEQKTYIANEWANGIPTQEIADKYNISKKQIRQIAEYKNKTRTPLTTRKYNINNNFFNYIETEQQAYWLGFITADGCVYNNVLSLGSVDKDHLIRFQQDIDSDYPINIQLKENNHYLYIIYISSKNIINDLYKLNIMPRKTGNEIFPSQIPEKLYRHYIRGFIDGDGNLHINNHQNKYKDVRISFCCSNISFLLDIQNILIKECEVNKNLTNKKQTCHEIVYEGNRQAYRICKYLWYDSNIYLPRKIMPIINSGLLKETIQLGTYLDY